MKKAVMKMVSIILVISVLFSLMPLTALADTSGDYTYYTENGNATITGYTGSGTAISIPGSLGGFPVKKIGYAAFSFRTSLTSVSIPNSVTGIDNNAFFNCINLSSVSIPSSVTSMGDWIFSGCAKLSSVTLGSGITKLGDWSFSYCVSLVSLSIPNSVKIIGNSAFYNCTGLSNVTIPNSVNSIGSSAFENCTGLTSVTIGTGVTAIGSSAFYNCAKLVSANIPNGVTSIETKTFYGCTGLTGMAIPNTVTGIGSYAFYNCSSLSSVSIPNSVTGIGAYAFSYCASLTSVSISNRVTGIGDWVFSYCSKLSSVSLPSSVVTIGSNAFYNCTSLSSVTIPNSVKGIGSYAFYGCALLNNIIIPSSVTGIGDYAFYDCIGLTGLIIPDSVTGIGSSAFYNCKKMTSVTIGKGMINLGTNVFYNCESLTQIIIDSNNPSFSSIDGVLHNKAKTKLIKFPAAKQGAYSILSSVTGIDEYAFFNSKGLSSVVIPDSVTRIGSNAFNNCTGLKSATIGNGLVSIGASAFTYCTSLSSLTMGSKVTKIGEWAFSYCTSLLSVSIPSSTTGIDYKAFYSCTGLTDLTIGNNVTGIGNEAFSNCTGLINLSIGNSVTVIGSSAFSDCAKLTSVIIPASVTSIGPKAFFKCIGLSGLTIGNGVTVIGNEAFYNCTSLANATIPDSVTDIGASAFYNCTNLTGVIIGNRVTGIGSEVFRNCTSLTSATIPNSVRTIGDYAFTSCSALTSVTIGNSVTVIGDWMFSYCRKLTSVTIGNRVTSIDSYAFYDCTDLVSAIIPSSVTGIGWGAFYNCRKLTIYTTAGSYTESYALSNNIPVISIGASVRVTIPLTNNINPYSNMMLTLTNKTKNISLSVNITNASQYSFGGLFKDDTYLAAITNSYGNTIDKIDNMTLTKTINDISFSTIKQTKTVGLTVKDKNGNPLTNGVTVNWYDENERLLSQGSSLINIPVGMKLYYDILLNSSLGSVYIVPAKQSYTVGEGSNNPIFTLVSISLITLSGKVTDKATGTPVANAVVSISQLLNGKYSKNTLVITDNNGLFSAQVYKDKTDVIVSKGNYLNTVLSDIQSSFSGSSYNIGEIKLSPISGSLITLNMTYTHSVKSGGTPIVNTAYSDTANIVFTLYNQTQGKSITKISVQYPQIAVIENTNTGDVINITAASRNGDFKAITKNVTLDNNSTAAVQFDFVQNGSFIAGCAANANETNVAIIYDANGKYISAVDFNGTRADSGILPEGNYSVVFIAKSLFLNSIQTLSVFTSLGLAENTDYTKSAIQITAGAVTAIEGITIPALDETKLYYTDNVNTSFTVNKASAVTGSYFVLRSAYAIKDSYKSGVSNIKAVFSLPANCQLIPNSIVVGDELCSNYVTDGITVTVPVTDTSGIVRFCVIPAMAGNYKINAFLQFVTGGKTVKQPMGTASFSAEALTINLPEKTPIKTVTVSGITAPNSDVLVFDNMVAVGQTKALANGSWRVDVELYKPGTASIHDIYAEVTRQDGIKIISETKQLKYDFNYVVPSKVTMLYRGSSTVFAFINPSIVKQSYSYVPSNQAFTFTAEFLGNNELITFVNIMIWTTAGKVISLPAVFDETKNVWIAKGDFDINNLPINVSVNYNAKDVLEEIVVKYDIAAEYNAIYAERVNMVAKKTGNMVIMIDPTIYYIADETNGKPVKKEITAYPKISGNYCELVVDEHITNDSNHTKESIYVNNNSEDIFFKGQDLIHKLEEFTGQKFPVINGQKFVIVITDIPGNDTAGYQFNADLPGNNWNNKIMNVLDATILEKNPKSIDNLLAHEMMHWISYKKEPWLKEMNSMWAEDNLGNGVPHIEYTKEKLLNMDPNTLKNYFKDPNNFKNFFRVPKNAALDYGMADMLNHYLTKVYGNEIIKGILASKEKGYLSILKAIKDITGKDITWADLVKLFNEDLMNQIVPTKPTGPNVTPLIDPSGYVYEAVAANRQSGVTTTLFYKQNKTDITAIVWDAAEYQQENPLITDANGKYAWDVPQGWWQVKYEKSGYQTTYSDWLPVPPPQVDVNIGIVSFAQPNVSRVNGYTGYIDITFDRYMKLSSLSTDNISVKKNGTDCPGIIQFINPQANPKNISEQFTNKVRFVPYTGQFALTDVVELTVSRNVKSYAEVTMASDYKKTAAIAVEPKTITATKTLDIVYGGNGNINISVSPKESAIGKKVIAVSGSPSTAAVSAEAVINSSGNAVIPVTANMTGIAYITLTLEGTGLSTQTKIVVAMPTAPPAAPAGLKAISASYNSIKLTWTASANATGYAIYRAASSAGPYTYITSTTLLTYTNTPLTTGTTYYYKIYAYRLVNSKKVAGPYTAAVSAKPAPSAPMQLKAFAASLNSIKLTWTASAGATGYLIYRAASSAGTYTYLTSTALLTYTNTSLTTGTNYYYKVSAYRLVNSKKVTGSFTAAVYAKPAPLAPTRLTAVSASYNSIKLTWAASAGATGYAIYRAVSKTGTYTYVASTSLLTYTNTSLTTGKTYYYKVSAYRLVSSKKVAGAFTAPVSAKPLLNTPGGFTAAKASASSIKLTWKTVAGATGYSVYRYNASTKKYDQIKVLSAASFVNTGLTKNVTYYYKVAAYHLEGTIKVYSIMSSSKSAKPY